MHASPADLGVCLVTGGAGFLGGHLTGELRRRGLAVRILDLVPPPAVVTDDPAVQVVQGDIADPAVCEEACRGVDTVFHCAAIIDPIGMLPRERRDRNHLTNVTGTRNMVTAARDAGAGRFVYVSSNNVVFDAEPASGLDENQPYPTRFIDVYTETKGEAERIVLGADGEGGMNTAAVRPGGIYGPGDTLILGRMVAEAAHGRLVVAVGDPAARTDFTYVGNLVDAMTSLAEALGPDSKVRGRAYFVNDGVPSNSFGFARPVLESLGLTAPKAHIPGRIAYSAAAASEAAFGYLHGPRPFLSRAECLKVSEDNWYTIERAAEDFGWRPPFSMQEGLRASLPWCREVLAGQEVVGVPHPGWWALLVGAMVGFGVVVFDRRVNAAFHRGTGANVPQPVLVGGFAAACATHVAEAAVVWRRARRSGFDRSAWRWAAQTLLVGFPSMRNLNRAIRARAAQEESAFA